MVSTSLLKESMYINDILRRVFSRMPVNISSLSKNQLTALKSFIMGSDSFVLLPDCYGKSLMIPDR